MNVLAPLPPEIIVVIMQTLSSLDELCLASSCHYLWTFVNVHVRARMSTSKLRKGTESLYAIQNNTLYSLYQWPVLENAVGIDFWLIAKMDMHRLRLMQLSIRERMHHRDSHWHTCLGDMLQHLIKQASMNDAPQLYYKLTWLASQKLLPHLAADLLPLQTPEKEKLAEAAAPLEPSIMETMNMIRRTPWFVRGTPTRVTEARLIKVLLQSRFGHEWDRAVDRWLTEGECNHLDKQCDKHTSFANSLDQQNLFFTS